MSLNLSVNKHTANCPKGTWSCDGGGRRRSGRFSCRARVQRSHGYDLVTQCVPRVLVRGSCWIGGVSRFKRYSDRAPGSGGKFGLKVSATPAYLVVLLFRVCNDIVYSSTSPLTWNHHVSLYSSWYFSSTQQLHSAFTGPNSP